MENISRKTWEEFRDVKLLWWVNRILHLFGWVIVCKIEDDGTVSEVYPARTNFRGFDEEAETKGFIGLTKYLGQNIDELEKESME